MRVAGLRRNSTMTEFEELDVALSQIEHYTNAA
jgi:hypothetical protein